MNKYKLYLIGNIIGIILETIKRLANHLIAPRKFINIDPSFIDKLWSWMKTRIN